MEHLQEKIIELVNNISYSEKQINQLNINTNSFNNQVEFKIKVFGDQKEKQDQKQPPNRLNLDNFYLKLLKEFKDESQNLDKIVKIEDFLNRKEKNKHRQMADLKYLIQISEFKDNWIKFLQQKEQAIRQMQGNYKEQNQIKKILDFSISQQNGLESHQKQKMKKLQMKCCGDDNPDDISNKEKMSQLFKSYDQIIGGLVTLCNELILKQ